MTAVTDHGKGTARQHAGWSALAFAGLAVAVARVGDGWLGQFGQAVIRKLQAVIVASAPAPSVPSRGQ